MKLDVIFEPRDFWIGFYWNPKKRWLYFLPVPMIGLVFKFGPRTRLVEIPCNCGDEYFPNANCDDCHGTGLIPTQAPILRQ